MNPSAISGEVRALGLAALTTLFIVLLFTTGSGLTILVLLVPAVVVGGIWMAATLRGRTLGHTGLGFVALLLAFAAGFLVTPGLFSLLWLVAQGEPHWWVAGSILALVGFPLAAGGAAFASRIPILRIFTTMMLGGLIGFFAFWGSFAGYCASVGGCFD